MDNTITLDFRYNYQKGDRRIAEQMAYQWDLGHILEIYVPTDATSFEIHYFFTSFTETEDYAVESHTAADDGGYKIIAHVPNKFFEQSGELRLYVIGSDDGHVLTTYEGAIPIRERLKPEDYTDDDPENGAQSILEKAEEFAQESEAWARGTKDGTAVPSTADQYQNNSKYYAEQASGSATNASAYELNSEAWAVGTKDGTAVTSDDPQYQNSSKYHAQQASNSASSASGSATAAATSEDNAEAWAVGTKNGIDVGSGDPQYHNNSKYYAEQMEYFDLVATGDGTVTITLSLDIPTT